MKPLKNIFIVLILTNLLTTPTALAQEKNIKVALQNIVESLEKLSQVKPNTKNNGRESEELNARKIAFKNILELSFVESSNLKNKLIELGELESRFSDLRNRHLKELGNHTSYYESISIALEKETSLTKVRELAIQFKDWRKVVYHPALQKIINFLLIFEGRDVLQTTERRIKNISADLKKVDDLEIIKNSPLSELLSNAEKSFKEARELQSAAELVILKSNENDIQKLIEGEIEKIKETYSYFIKMSDWVRQTSKK